MRITFLLPHDHASGGMRSVREHARHLAARGHQVQLLMGRSGLLSGRTGKPLTGRQLLERRLRRALKPLRRFSRDAWRFGPGTARRALKAAASARAAPSTLAAAPAPQLIDRVDGDSIPEAEVLIVYDWSSALAAAALPAKCGRQCYLVQAEETLLGAPAEYAEAALQLPNRKIVISSWLKAMLKERHGQEAAGPVVCGVDFDQFHSVTRPEARVGRVGMVCWSAPYKGSGNGLRAFALARQRRPELRLTLFGRELPDFRLPRQASFHLDPPQEELKRLYSSCAIWLSPSLIEGLGMPVQEAMACGCAVVATDVGGVRDFGREGENVIIVPPGEVEAMADQIVALCEDDARRSRLGAAAEVDIRAFTWEAASEQLEAILLEEALR